MNDLRLEFCSSRDVADFENRHYVEKMPKSYFRATEHSKPAGKPRGHHGQQVHFLIWYKGENVGAISAGSAVYATAVRDSFFGITKDNREQTLNGVIDNTLFRLEYSLDRNACVYGEEDAKKRKCLNRDHNHNLATQVLALWRRNVVEYWEYLYGVKPFGFETFVEQDDIAERPGKQRLGRMYLADNWIFVGETQGSTKNHITVDLTGEGGGGGSFARNPVKPKLVFCKWVKRVNEPQYHEYKSSWKAATKGGTPEERAIAKAVRSRRKKCMGTSCLGEVEDRNERMVHGLSRDRSQNGTKDEP
jgi:hypothetical protein